MEHELCACINQGVACENHHRCGGNTKTRFYEQFILSSAWAVFIFLSLPGLVVMLVSMVALRGTGRGEVEGDLVGLTLAEREPFSSFFTSFSSVPVATAVSVILPSKHAFTFWLSQTIGLIIYSFILFISSYKRSIQTLLHTYLHAYMSYGSIYLSISNTF